MRGWFDAFRHDGGPTLYDHANRTAVTGDVPTITLCVVFITLFVAFVIVFPGIRKERLTTFTTVTLSLFVGAVILVGSFGSEWHTADREIVSAYRAFSPEKIIADLGIHIGFNHVNVTLRSSYFSNDSSDMSDRIDYNERFSWCGPTDMTDEYSRSLSKGLPFPILTVAEYLSLDDEGFGWGRIYRKAGYFSAITLWSSFAAWLLMNILLVVVPRYGAYMMVLTGALMISTNILYYALLPSRPLIIRFEDVLLTFSLGWCYWLVFTAGLMCVIAGLVICMVEVVMPHKFSTILELDYDTPYDRHIIIEESHHTKQKKRKMEEPLSSTFGSKIFRRFSKRGENDAAAHADLKYGVVNPAMEFDPPKSPWRYPHRTFSAPIRSESRKSTKSVNFREHSVVYGATLLPPGSTAVASVKAYEADVVDVIPNAVWMQQLVPEVQVPVSADVDSLTSYSSDSDVSSMDDDVGDTVERIHRAQMSSVVAVDFQSQFRGVSRQNSRDSHHSQDPSIHLDPPVQLDPASIQLDASIHASASGSSIDGSSGGGSRKTSTASRASRASTPSRRISAEDNAIQLDRMGSQRQSGLASISARISAAAEADRSKRRISGEESYRVDMW